MKYNKNIVKSLILLLKGEMIYAGRLGELSELLYQRGHFSVTVIRRRVYYTVKDAESMKIDLAKIDESLTDLEGLLQIYENKELSRGELAKSCGNSKLKKRRVFNGFLVNSYEPINTILQGKPYVLKPVEGTFVFVYDWQNFLIPENVVVVGIENSENYEKIREQKSLFEGAVEKMSGFRSSPLLFVSRYPQENSSADLRRWLQAIPNKYIHYGDLDFKGIDIFHREFYKYLGKRSSFLIPQNVESLIKGGIKKRYNDQYNFRNISSPIPEVQKLIEMINKYKRGVDQECFEEI